MALKWAIYHNPPDDHIMGPIIYDTKPEADEAVERLEAQGVRYLFVDRIEEPVFKDA
jgi:hypothetical protein